MRFAGTAVQPDMFGCEKPANKGETLPSQNRSMRFDFEEEEQRNERASVYQTEANDMELATTTWVRSDTLF